MVHAPVPEPQGPAWAASRPSQQPSKWWLAVPFALFALLVAWKLTFLKGMTIGFTTYDEIVYFKEATALASGHMYRGVEYPWLYAISLLPAFLFHDPHRAAIALSAVYSSTLVFPVWLIAREMLGLRHAAVVTALTCLLPYHYVVGRTLLSEQLYYPMLVLAVYLVVTGRWRWSPLSRDLLTGALIGALYATRYLTVPMIPALVFGWWLRERAASGRWLPSRRALGRLALATLAGLAVFLPWVLAAVRAHAPWKATLGLEVARSKLPPTVRPTLGGFLVYGGLYLAAWSLALAPLLGMLGFANIRALQRGGKDGLDRLTLTMSALALGLLVILTRHSWLATYNYPEPLRIMVRYAIYIVGLGVIVGYAAAATSVKSRPLPAWATWLVGFVLPMIAVAASWWGQVGSQFLPNSLAAIDGGAGDVYRIMVIGPWLWPAVAAALALTTWLLVRRDARLVAGLVLGAVVFYSLGITAYGRLLERSHDFEMIAYRLAAVDKAQPAAPGDYLRVAASPAAIKLSGLTFRAFTKNLEWNIQYFRGGAHLLTPGETDPPDYVIEAARSYSGPGTRVTIGDRTYVIVRGPGAAPAP